jgi:RNA polymerase sigma-70 factor (ECF subfamily)
MLGSFEEAEDVVQETMLRAWRRRDDLAEVENFRAWLYKIATNTCLDLIKAKKRRVASLGSFRDISWLEPYPDRLLTRSAPAGDEPQAVAIGRETIELTFLAVIQTLPPRQRATLILRDVLDWPVREVAALLELSPAAVNSALQRARASMRSLLPTEERETWSATTPTQTEREVLGRYIRAYEAGDTDATLTLIADDIRVTMPPAPYLFEGRDAIAGLAQRARSTGEWRLVPTAANRQPAAACYLRESGQADFRAFKLDVLRVVDGVIAEITTFGPKHFDAFDLPLVVS